LLYKVLLCAFAHGVKSEILQVTNFAWHRLFCGGKFGVKKGGLG